MFSDAQVAGDLAAVSRCPIEGCEWEVFGGGRCADHGGPPNRHQWLRDCYGHTVYRQPDQPQSPILIRRDYQ